MQCQLVEKMFPKKIASNQGNILVNGFAQVQMRHVVNVLVPKISKFFSETKVS